MIVECAFLGRETFRDMYLDAQVEVAASTAAELVQTLAAQAQYLVRLGPGRYRDVRLTLQCGGFQFGPENQVGDFKRLTAPQIGAGTLKA